MPKGMRFSFGVMKMFYVDYGDDHTTLNILKPMNCRLYMGGLYGM